MASLPYKAFLEKSDSVLYWVDAFCKGRDPEAVHNMRVAMKKLRSIIRLAAHCNADISEKAAFRPYRKLFRRAGKLRDLQNIQVHSRAFGLVFKDKQLQAIQRAEEKLLKRIKGFEDKLEGKRVLQLRDFSPVTAGLINRYQLEIWKKAAWMLIPDASQEHLHEARKLLKDLLTLSDLSGAHPEGIPSVQALNDLQRNIGDWHDLEVLLLYWRTVGTKKGENVLKSIYREMAALHDAIRNKAGALQQNEEKNVDE